MIQRSMGLCRAAALLAFIAAVVASTPMVWAQSYIFNRADFPTGTSPAAVIIADFNGDGKSDLAVANYADNTVSILLGIPGGTFAPQKSYVTGTSPTGLVTADFNRDGKLDLAVVNYQANTVSVLLGNGDGTFQTHTDYATGNHPFAVVAADFNADGKIDLAIANENLIVGNPDTVSILLGNGDGSFTAQTAVPVGAQPIWLASADFNGDGRVDLITSNIGDGTVTVLLSNGDGTFTRIDSPSGLFPGPNRSVLTVGDFNGDGKLDVVVSSESAQLFLLLGNGDGSFQAPVVIPNSLVGGITFVLAGDFNHDGRLDLLQQGTVVLLGNGDGTFQPPVASPLGVTTSAASFAAADFNGDGALDLVATDSNLNSVDVFLGNGDGTFGSASTFALAANIYFLDAAVVADFNGDGKLDVAVAEVNFPNGQVSVQLGNGDGTFQAPIVSPLSIQGVNNGGWMIAADFNGDGKPDLVIMDDYAVGFEVLMGNGDGTFQPPVNTPLNYTVLSLAVGDFNGDGKADAVTTTNGSGAGLNPSMNIYLGMGDGSFRLGATHAVLPYSNVVVADVNQDGKPDLIVTGFGAPLQVFLGNGDGTFKSPISGPTGIFSGIPVVADFNGDGRPDIAVGTYTGIAFLAGNGDGTFQAPVYSLCGLACSGSVTAPPLGFSGGMVAGDFNGDGRLDLASAPPFDTVLGGPVVMVGNGDGTFQAPFAYGGGTAGGPLAGDFNSDGISDLAVAGSAVVTVYLSGRTLDFFPGALVFEPQNSGTTSSAQQVKLTNLGSGTLTLSSIQVTGDFAETNDCGNGLGNGEICAIAVTFQPTASGPRSGTISFTDNAAASPQTVSLAGTGYGPFVSLSPPFLTFASQFVGSSATAQAITILNAGTAPLSIGEVAVSGPQASDFLQTNTCSNPLAAGANCTISVVFKPSASGIRNASVTVTDNASGSPQAVPVSGTGMSFGLAIASGGSGSATVAAGATATYNLVIGGAGFAGTATLTCTGAPRGAICSVPGSITLDAASPSPLAVTVTTTSRTSAGLSIGRAPWLWAMVVFGWLLLPGLQHKRSASRCLKGLSLLLLLAICSCGGGSTSSGTPAGQYTLTVTAATGANNQSLPLTLIVQ